MDNEELLKAIRAIVKEEIQANNEAIKKDIQVIVKENNLAIGNMIISSAEILEQNIGKKLDDINFATATNSYDIAVLRSKKQA